MPQPRPSEGNASNATGAESSTRCSASPVLLLAACLPAAALLLQAFGPGSFAAGRHAGEQLFGVLSWAVLAWVGRQTLGDPLGLSELGGRRDQRSSTAAAGGRRAIVGWWTLLGWLPALLALLGAVRFPDAMTLRILGLTILGTLSVGGTRRLVELAPRGVRWTLLLALAAVALAAGGFAWHSRAAPALPLGHHNLLVLFLVPWLPLAVHSWFDRPPRWVGRGGLAGRAQALLRPSALLITILASIGVVLATRSLTGFVALGFLALWSAVTLTSAWRRRVHSRPGARGVARRQFALVMALAVVVTSMAWPRVSSMLRGQDVSAQARMLYLEAAVGAVAQRPLLGWGLGRGGFGLQAELAAQPGVRVPGQLLSDAHALWFDLLVEAGGFGFGALLLLVALMARRIRSGGSSLAIRQRRAGAEAGVDSLHQDSAASAVLALRRTGSQGLLVLAVTAGFAGWFDVGALWLSCTLLVALALGPLPHTSTNAAAPTRSVLLSALLISAALLATGPDLISRSAAAQADRVDSPDPAARHASLQRAARWGSSLDQLALGLFGHSAPAATSLRANAAVPERESLRGSRLPPETEAPRAPRDVPHPAEHQRQSELWLRNAARESDFWFAWTLAGDEAWQAGDAEWALAAWRRACDLEPFAPFAPLRLAQAGASAEAEEALARALMADPRVAGAAVDAEMLRRVVAWLSGHEGLPVGWRQALVDAMAAHDAVDAGQRGESSRAALELRLDREGETSFSLFFYRRAPRPRSVPMIEVDFDTAQRFAFEPAVRLPQTRARLWLPGCRLRRP